MICTEVAGMKRILVKIVLPVSLLAVWMITCYPICRKAEGFDFFLYWVLVGCPYGIRKNVYDSHTKKFRNCRKYRNTGTELYCRWSDWRCGCNSENGYGADGDNKDNQ